VCVRVCIVVLLLGVGCVLLQVSLVVTVCCLVLLLTPPIPPDGATSTLLRRVPTLSRDASVMVTPLSSPTVFLLQFAQVQPFIRVRNDDDDFTITFIREERSGVVGEGGAAFGLVRVQVRGG